MIHIRSRLISNLSGMVRRRTSKILSHSGYKCSLGRNVMFPIMMRCLANVMMRPSRLDYMWQSRMKLENIIDGWLSQRQITRGISSPRLKFFGAIMCSSGYLTTRSISVPESSEARIRILCALYRKLYIESSLIAGSS